MKTKPSKTKKKKTKLDGFTRSAGSWNGLIDPEELVKNIYSSRLVSARTEAELSGKGRFPSSFTSTRQ